MQTIVLCRSRRELSNAYLLAKFRFDTAENEPCKACPIERRDERGAAGTRQSWAAGAAGFEAFAGFGAAGWA